MHLLDGGDAGEGPEVRIAYPGEALYIIDMLAEVDREIGLKVAFFLSQNVYFNSTYLLQVLKSLLQA